MEEPGGATFARLLRHYANCGVIKPEDSVLVQFAGAFDEAVCREVGLVNCTFANIAPQTHSTGETVAQKFDAHRMPQADRSFDHVLAHSGVHHCSRPHEAVHEMYRLARSTVLFVENQDSAMMRLATKAGVVSWHELPAVVDGGYESGGVDGTGVPNFVYRWTTREVEKMVASFDPAYATPVEFHREWNLGADRVSAQTLQRKLSLDQRRAGQVLDLGYRVLNRTLARQGNIFAAMIRKDLAKLHPWMVSPTRMAKSYIG